MARRERGTRKIVPGETVPFDEQGNVRFRAPPYTSLQVEPVLEIRSVRYISQRGRIPPGSRAVITLHHGTGAPYSHSGAMLSILNTLTAGPSKKAQGFVPDLQRDPAHLFLAAEAVDCPGHGAGPDLNDFQDLESVVDWLATEFKDLRNYGPVVPLTRSGAAGVMIRLNAKYPGLIDGMILMSPLHPVGLPHSMAFLSAAAERPPDHPDFVIIRWDAINWINSLYGQIQVRGHWPQQGVPFGETPTLILMGMKDPQISPEARDHFIRYADPSLPSADRIRLSVETGNNVRLRGNRVWYFQLAKADHDVLENRDRESASVARSAYGEIFSFLRQQVLKSKTP